VANKNLPKDFKQKALDYHKAKDHWDSRPGKLEIRATKPLSTQRDLSYAYSPGVAEPCNAIKDNPDLVYDYTAKGNLVAVVSNGTAVLGLGDIGPLASKPVMEGKAVLFKKFAGIDCFDIELKCESIEHLIKTVQALEPTFGGINLEDIKAPDCFEVEARLRESMNIPVFHDDQHGTAIISGAALLNAIEVTGKKIEKIKVVFCGGGAASIACAKFWLSLGVKPENCVMTDRNGVIYEGRGDELTGGKDIFAIKDKSWHKKPPRSLADAMVGADVFLGCSVADVVDAEMLKSMGKKPIVFALANPNPEVNYNMAKAARPDLIFATGRSDYPNQINNVLCFPFLFRGALDVRSSAINEEMKKAASSALARLAKEDVPEQVINAYGGDPIKFGSEYLIPKPFDPRVFLWVAPAVAKAAIETGVARIGFPGGSIEAYTARLDKQLGKTRSVMRDQRGRLEKLSVGKEPVKIVFPEGTNEKILKAASIVKDEGIAEPILLGSTRVIQEKIAEYSLDNLKDCQIIRPSKSPDYPAFVEKMLELRQRKGMTREQAEQDMKDPFYFSAMQVNLGHAEASLSGLTRSYRETISPNLQIVGAQKDRKASGVYMLIWKDRVLFLADTTVNIHPTAEDLVDIALNTADVAEVMGFQPRVAMLGFSSFGANRDPEAMKVSRAVKILQEAYPKMIVDGEIQADLAVNQALLEEKYPFSKLVGKGANILIFPNLASANTSYKLLSQLSEAELVGPILVGMRKPVHILQNTSDINQIVNMAIITALDVRKVDS